MAPLLGRSGTYADDRIMKRVGGRQAGETFWCHVTGRAVDRNAPHAAGIWSFEDLSARRPVRAELTAAFEVTRAAMQEERPLVFVVAHDDLLGRRGSGRAMVAAGLLSAARTAAVEARRSGVPVNTLAVEAEWDPETVARWVLRLMERGGPTGELVRLGGDHLGKALP